MTQADILGEILALPLEDQLEIIESVARLVRQRSQSHPSCSVAPRDLAAAAQAIRDDYVSDAQLTALTALDCEDFHAAG